MPVLPLCRAPVPCPETPPLSAHTNNLGKNRPPEGHCWTRPVIQPGARVTVMIRVGLRASRRIVNSATARASNANRVIGSASVIGIGVLGAGTPSPTG